MKYIYYCIGILTLAGILYIPVYAALITPSESSGGTSSSLRYTIQQSIGQSIIGKSASPSYQVWSGFQFFPSVGTLTLQATAGTQQAALSWNALTVRGGATVHRYEVGIGTFSGVYTFQSVGTATSFIKTGLQDATTYYVVVKAVNASGGTLAFSNEISFTTASAPVNTGGGGGGGGGGSVSSDSATVVLSGMAFPGASVTILKDGSIITKTTADPGATFKVSLTGLIPTQYVFSVYATDAKGVQSPSYSVPLTLAPAVTVDVANIFLAPTIGVSATTVKKGDPINIFGTSVPGATVSISVHSAQEFVERVVASAAGVWFKQFDTTPLEIGNHSTYSRAVKGDRVTDKSIVVPFIVGNQTTLAPITTKRSDLNRDGKVNSIDLSMLLFYWNKTVASSVAADITRDGKVNVSDLSILLYEWTG